MPGIVVFNRRWAVGSDDLVVPGIFLCLLHVIWFIILSGVLVEHDFVNRDKDPCVNGLWEYLLGYMVLFVGCILIEAAIAWVSLRGTILFTEPRASMKYLLYVRLGILFVEIGWLVIGVMWLSRYYSSCPVGSLKDVTVGIVISNFCVILSVFITIWCTFDAAGRSWVKMKNYQRSLRDSKTKFNYKRSGSLHRDWRHRKVVRAYQESWNTRCRLLFCCVGKNDRHRNSFTEIAKLLSEFFRDLDVVPSDVVAGLVLLRKQQKMVKKAIVAQKENETYEFLSGIPITPTSRFLALHDPEVLEEFQNVIHYMRYALAVYGWPMYIKGHAGTGICRLCPYLRCCCCPPCYRRKHRDNVATVVEDNCCQCNHAATCRMLDLQTDALVYVTYHVEVGETPFFVAVDHEKRKIVVSIRGTLSLQDVITDLNAEGEILPIDPPQEEWIGHKGMVQAAEYIRKKLREEMVLSKAFGYDTDRGTQTYEIVLVGHSLGAGTAVILAILLKQEFPNLLCYAYSPPGGLLSMPAVEFTKSFITSVVIGKDVVPRIGLHQMESLRSDLINAIKGSEDPKWKVIASSVVCCHTGSSSSTGDLLTYDLPNKQVSRDEASHPSDANIALTVHQPLFPPGRIIHIVRHHPSKAEQVLNKPDPVYQALWAENTDFDEVLISPVMIQDHMPDKVLEALEKVLSNVGPAKPQRIFTESVDQHHIPTTDSQKCAATVSREHTPPHRLCLETSFTDLNPENIPASSDPSSSSQGELAPASITLSWEYGITIEDHHQMSNGGGPLRGNNRSLLTTCVGPRLDLCQQDPDWTALAPLATPETLSEVSSVSSRSSSSRFGSARFSHAARCSVSGVTVHHHHHHHHHHAHPDVDETSLHLRRLSDRTRRKTEFSLEECQIARNQQAAVVMVGTDDLDVEEESNFFTETSHLLAEVLAEVDGGTAVTTEAVIEDEPRLLIMPSEYINVAAVDLESDSELPTYEGARLSFDLSQDTTTNSKTSEDTGYHGELEVFAMSLSKDPVAADVTTMQAATVACNGKGSVDGGGGCVTDITRPQLPSRHSSYRSAADTISDVFDHSLGSNVSPLISPASIEVAAAASAATACTSVLIDDEQPDQDLGETTRPSMIQAWTSDGLYYGKPSSTPCSSPRKWGCARQTTPTLPREIIPQVPKVGSCFADSPSPRMCFQHKISPDESSV